MAVYLGISGLAACAQSAGKRGTKGMTGICVKGGADAAANPAKNSTIGTAANADAAEKPATNSTIGTAANADDAEKPATNNTTGTEAYANAAVRPVKCRLP